MGEGTDLGLVTLENLVDFRVTDGSRQEGRVLTGVTLEGERQ